MNSLSKQALLVIILFIFCLKQTNMLAEKVSSVIFIWIREKNTLSEIYTYRSVSDTFMFQRLKQRLSH